MAGWSTDAIAAELGVTNATVSRDRRLLHERWRQAQLIDTEAQVTLEAARLEARHRAFWDVAQAGDVDADKQLNQIAVRKAKLLGLDSAHKVDLTLQTAEEQSVEAKVNKMAENLAAGKEMASGWGDADLGDPSAEAEVEDE